MFLNDPPKVPNAVRRAPTMKIPEGIHTEKIINWVQSSPGECWKAYFVFFYEISRLFDSPFVTADILKSVYVTFDIKIECFDGV